MGKAGLFHRGTAFFLLTALGAAAPVAADPLVLVDPTATDPCSQWTLEGRPFVYAADFSEYSLRILRTLDSHCIRQVGDLNLQKLADEIARVEAFIFTVGFFAAGEENNRESAVCDPAKKRVLLSCYDLLRTRESTRDLLALHDALCAAGYVDDDYQLSTGLWLLAQQLGLLTQDSRSPFKNIQHRTELPKYPVKPDSPLAGGGVTNVGGGGDAFALEVKAGALAKIASQFKRPGASGTNAEFARLMDLILNAKFEPDPTLQGSEIQVGRTEDGRLRLGIARALTAQGSNAVIEQVVAAIRQQK